MNILTTALTNLVAAEAAAELLLERGADIEARNLLTDETPLLFMVRGSSSPQMLRFAGSASPPLGFC